MNQGKKSLCRSKVPETAPQTILECFENGLSISRDRVVCGIPQLSDYKNCNNNFHF